MSTHTEHSEIHAQRTYTITLAALLTLTFITVFAAGVDFGSNSINIAIALTIATIKASLVGLIFMHLMHDKAANAVIMVAGFVFLSLFLGFTLTDIGSRVHIDVSSHKPPAGGPAAIAAAEAAKKGAAKPAAEAPAGEPKK